MLFYIIRISLWMYLHLSPSKTLSILFFQTSYKIRRTGCFYVDILVSEYFFFQLCISGSTVSFNLSSAQNYIARFGSKIFLRKYPKITAHGFVENIRFLGFGADLLSLVKKENLVNSLKL